MKIHKLPDAAAAAQACAKDILERLHARLAMSGSASLAISGGTSPTVMFEYFARALFPWEHVHLFWVDERCVPPEHPESNYKLAFDTWLHAGQFPPDNIHRIEGERDPQDAAKRYREDIQKYFHLGEGQLPRFDAVHLGMGPDGHTASLFPGSELTEDRSGITAAVFAENMPQQWRVTLLPGVLESARHAAMMTAGADKAAVLRAVFQEPYDPKRYPAQLATRGEAREWFVDHAAAALLKA